MRGALFILGMVLVAGGILGLAYGGVSYWRREKVIDIGPVEASVDKKETIPISPIAGGVAVVAGVALMLSCKRTSGG